MESFFFSVDGLKPPTKNKNEKRVAEEYVPADSLWNVHVGTVSDHPDFIPKPIKKPRDLYPYTPPIPYPKFPITLAPPMHFGTDKDKDMDTLLPQQKKENKDASTNTNENEMSASHYYYYTEELSEKPFTHDHDLYYCSSFLPQFKVGRLPDDDDDVLLLLQQLVDAQPSFVPPPFSDFNIKPKVIAALLVLIDTTNAHAHIWEIIRAHNFALYISVIIAAASIVYKLHSKVSLFHIGSLQKTHEQILELWDNIEWMRKEHSPLSEVCKEIDQLMTDKEKFSFVTQPSLDSLIDRYCEHFSGNRTQFPPPEARDAYPYFAFNPFSALHKDGVMNQIIGAVACREYPPELKADEHTRLLMRLIRVENEKEEVKLVDEAMRFVALPKLDSEDILELGNQDEYDINTQEHYNKILHVRDILNSMIRSAKERMKYHLMDVTWPLFELHNLACLHLAPEIFEIVQVAEVHRMSLGNRFIGRSHLIWAFYELGYGLPPIVRKKIKVHSDEDHPPYHIYLAVVQLTKSLGEKCTQLDHFIFAVIYSKVIGFDGKVTDLLDIFGDLRKALMSSLLEPIGGRKTVDKQESRREKHSKLG